MNKVIQPVRRIYCNRHAEELDSYTQSIQVALNRNGHKPGIEFMTRQEIAAKALEEVAEAIHATAKLHAALSRPDTPEWLIRKLANEAEKEWGDVGVVGTAGHNWVRRRT